MDFVFVGEIVADRGHAEIAGFDQGFDRFDHRKFERCELVLVFPGSLPFEIRGIFRQLLHGGGDGLVGDGDKTLRAAFGSAGVAINLDEAVIEIDRGVVLDPGGAEGNPVGVFAGLVVADEMGNRFGLRGIGVAARLLEAEVGLLQERGIQSGRDFVLVFVVIPAVGRSGAVDEFGEFAIGGFHHPRVQGILILKSFQIAQA